MQIVRFSLITLDFASKSIVRAVRCAGGGTSLCLTT